MRRPSLIIAAVISLFYFLPAPVSASTKEALQTAVALNYCHMSLYRVLSYNDRIVLDEEYTEIINNINLTKIQDEEIINLLRTLMDTISDFKLAEGDKGFLAQEYEHQVANALYASFSGLANPLAAGVNPFVVAAKTLIQAGSVYSNYRNNIKSYRKVLDKAVWDLDKKAIVRLNETRKNFLVSYWRLMKKYDIPDRWRLTEKQMELFMTVLRDDDAARRFRRLSRMEAEFEAYPPFWYYLGQAAQEVKQTEAAVRAYDRFIGIQQGFFREDNFYSSVLMNRIELLSPEKDGELIIRNLEGITKESPLDFRKNLFAALWYIRVKRFDEAKERLLVNIDNKKEVSISNRLLGEVYAGKYDRVMLESLVDEMQKADTVRNQDVLEVIGKMPEGRMLSKMKDQIADIYVSLQRQTLKRDTLVLTVPDKWVLADFENFQIMMVFQGKEYRPTRLTADKTKRLLSYYFEEMLDLGDFLKNRRNAEVRFHLNHPSSPMTLVGDLTVVAVERPKGYVEKGYDKTVNLLTGKKTPRGQAGIDYDVGFRKREIRTAANCYRIDERGDFGKCPFF